MIVPGFLLKGIDVSTKLSHGRIEQRETLMLKLENAVLALETGGVDHNTIHGMVNCILKGFIVNGNFVPEYIEHIENILKEKAEIQKQEEFRQAFGVGSSLSSGA